MKRHEPSYTVIGFPDISSHASLWTYLTCTVKRSWTSEMLKCKSYELFPMCNCERFKMFHMYTFVRLWTWTYLLSAVEWIPEATNNCSHPKGHYCIMCQKSAGNLPVCNWFSLYLYHCSLNVKKIHISHLLLFRHPKTASNAVMPIYGHELLWQVQGKEAMNLSQ